mgnify:FL=1
MERERRSTRSSDPHGGANMAGRYRIIRHRDDFKRLLGNIVRRSRDVAQDVLGRRGRAQVAAGGNEERPSGRNVFRLNLRESSAN